MDRSRWASKISVGWDMERVQGRVSGCYAQRTGGNRGNGETWVCLTLCEHSRLTLTSIGLRFSVLSVASCFPFLMVSVAYGCGSGVVSGLYCDRVVEHLADAISSLMLRAGRRPSSTTRPKTVCVAAGRTASLSSAASAMRQEELRLPVSCRRAMLNVPAKCREFGWSHSHLIWPGPPPG
jgi:hypothetical protein